MVDVWEERHSGPRVGLLLNNIEKGKEWEQRDNVPSRGLAITAVHSQQRTKHFALSGVFTIMSTESIHFHPHSLSTLRHLHSTLEARNTQSETHSPVGHTGHTRRNTAGQKIL